MTRFFSTEIRTILCAAIVLIGVLLTGCAARESVDVSEVYIAPAAEAEVETAVEAEDNVPVSLVLQSVEEQGDTMVVSTSYCVLKYPFAFSDLIHVEAVNADDAAELCFTVTIESEVYKLFTISFNGEEGILLGTLALPNEDVQMDVYAQMHQAEESLNETALNIFMAAQEVFNDVSLSLAENEGFAPAAG